MSRNAPKERSKDQISQKEKDQSIAMLEDLLKVPGNEICAECSAKGPRWASINLGIFICIRCSGIHRNMGAHISKVKSVTLDFWTYEWVEGMRRMGNRKSNIMWEANLPSNFRKPTENDNNYGVEQFIRDKYERKKWYNPGALSGSNNEGQDTSSSTSRGRSEDDDRQRRERREQRRREKEQQQQLLLQQQQQQQFQQQQQQQKQPQQTSPQKQPNSVDDLFADFSTPTSTNSAINFGDFQSAGFFSSSPQQPQQPQQQQQQQQTQPQNTQSSANSFFGGGNADFFGSNNQVDTKAKEKEEILSLFRTPNPQQGYGYPGQQYGGGGYQNNMMMNNQPNFTSSAIHSYGMGNGMGGGMGNGGMNMGGYQNTAMNNYNNNMMMMNNNVAANNFNAMNNNFGFTNPGMPQTPQSSNSAFRF